MSPFTRRKLLANTLATAGAAAMGSALGTPASAAGASGAAVPRGAGEPGLAAGDPSLAGPADVSDGVELHWLDGVPAASTGTSWGIPWPRGAVQRHSQFALSTGGGTAVPVQSWPLAYWPDGTLKWTGHGISATAPGSDTYRLTVGAPAAPDTPVTVTRSRDGIQLSNGLVDVLLAAGGTDVGGSAVGGSDVGGSAADGSAVGGSVVIRTISRSGRVTASDGQLVLLLQDNPDSDGESSTVHCRMWTGAIEHAEVEQSGPVRAVVRLSGTYRSASGSSASSAGDRRRLLPWTLRVYLGTGDESLRLVHSFMWNADMARDFVRGLGLRLSVPMSDDAHNRHIRFSTTAGGVWGEPVRVLTGLRRDPGAAVRAAQVAGTATPPVDQWAATVQAGYQQLALWNDFTLFQDSPSHFAVWKRTTVNGSWLKHAGYGQRASGFGYVGGPSGGLGVGLRDFWQRFPRSLDIRGAAGDTATVTIWSWSPQAPAMDVRHYDLSVDSTGQGAGQGQGAHEVPHGLDLAYEDVQEGFSTPEGMVRSTDMQLWAFAATPSRDEIVALTPTLTAPPQMVAAPAWYHGAGVFGRWSLPDRTTAARATLEDSIARDVAFYTGQVEQRQWYGFWSYGDVMHTYDADRHSWRYDVGGYAWDNAELGSDAALWYAFLRSGDAGTFRLARAMTQHVSEVDTHHSGRFAGLGSRHNVVHWGDGAKEARVSESYTKRFSYYLTTDELLGDLIRTSLQADHTLLTVEPLREVLPPQTLAPTRLRIGPDWYALVSNWLTEWERTGDVRWRDRIVTGMQDIATFPAGLFTGEAGGAVGFDPATAHLTNFNKGDYLGGYNLAMAFCGEQVLWEALDLVDVPEFRAVLLDFARYVQAPSAEKIARYGFDFNPQVFKTIYSRVTAWAGEQLNDAAIRTRGWQQFTTDPAGLPWPAAVHVGGDAVVVPVDEIPKGDFATNDAAQRCLAIISLLAVAPAEAP